MAMPRKDPATIAAWRDAYEKERKSVHQIAEQFGTSGSTVAKHLRRVGVEMRSPYGEPTKATPANLRAWHAIYQAEGLSLDELSARVDVAPSTLSKGFARLSLPRRRPGIRK